MYNIVNAVIESKNYELVDMLKKLDTFWVQGRLTEEQHTELVALARENALPENSYAGLQKLIDHLYSSLNETRKEVESLKKRVSTLEGTAEDEAETPEDANEYPDYVQPTGAHDAYYTNVKMTFEGEKYICIAPEGVAVVWNPHVMPAYWQKVTE